VYVVHRLLVILGLIDQAWPIVDPVLLDCMSRRHLNRKK
jgi:hypothetical protein